MRKMFSSLIVFGLVGCGGGGGSKTPDAKIFLDSGTPDAATCGIASTALNGTVGTVAEPGVPSGGGSWFLQPTTGPYMGKTIFAIGVLLNNNAAAQDSFDFLVAKPAAGGFPLNTALNFEINPAVVGPPVRTVGFGDEDTAAMTVSNIYWPSSGSITFTAISEANGGLITATVNNAMYREIDENGMDVPNGCTAMIGALTLNLKNGAGAFAPPTQGPAPKFGTEGITRVPVTLN